MLQQTQVATVIPYFLRFIDLFPTVETLAAARLDDVLAQWSGLGYYARARNLHRAAIAVVTQHGGRFPADPAALARLPGVGSSTAAAIAAQAYGVRAAILDGNVKRVLARHSGETDSIDQRATVQRLQELADALLPTQRLADYTQALMDLGALLCTRSQPHCSRCPLAVDCRAAALGLTAQLPVRNRRAARPLRQHYWLLALNSERQILLQRRVERGIWGGLWSPPEATSRAGLEAATGVTLGEDGPLLRHGFTHFELAAQCVYAMTAPLPAADQAYIGLHDTTIALPAPVRRLVWTLRQSAFGEQQM